MLLEVYEAFVGVYHLLQVNRDIHDVCERIALIITLVQLIQRLDVEVTFHYYCREYSACETATVGNEVNLSAVVGLQLLDALDYLGQVLMLERLVYAHVVIPPAEMCSSLWLDTCTGAAGDGIYRYVTLEQMLLCQRQQTKLNACGKATRVGNVSALACVAAVQLGQAIYEIMVVSLDAVIHGEVYYLQLIGQCIALQELACLAVSGAEEEQVNLLKRHLISEHQLGLAIKACMHVCYAVAGIAVAVYKLYFNFGVYEQQTYKFSRGVARTSNNSNSYHI